MRTVTICMDLHVQIQILKRYLMRHVVIGFAMIIRKKFPQQENLSDYTCAFAYETDERGDLLIRAERQVSRKTTAISNQEVFARSSLMNANPIDSRKTAGTTRIRRVSRCLCWRVKFGSINLLL